MLSSSENAAIDHVQDSIPRADHRHVFMSALKRGLVDPNRLREGLLEPEPVRGEPLVPERRQLPTSQAPAASTLQISSSA